MPYIGQSPSTGQFIELDALTASATDTYTLQLNSANYAPESVNNLIVSINGVVQKPSSMSLNGSSLTVGATLSSSDTIDYVRVLGHVGSVVTPTDGSVTTAKIGAGAVTGAKIASTISTDHTFSGTNTFSGTTTVPAATSGWRHIKTQTGTNVSSIDFLHGSNGVVFDDTYEIYEFIIHYVYGASNDELRIEPSQDGSSFSNTNTIGHSTGAYRAGGSSSAYNVDTGANGFFKSLINSGNAENEISGGQIRIYSPFDSAKNTVACTTFVAYQQSGTYSSQINIGAMTAAGRTHGIRFKISSGNIYAKISLYGIKDS
jgi:hypothetical protein